MNATVYAFDREDGATSYHNSLEGAIRSAALMTHGRKGAVLSIYRLRGDVLDILNREATPEAMMDVQGSSLFWHGFVPAV